ncbi:MAG: hypothetical protein J5601_06460 [Elusimicrobiaceae bacterium]|nr:hypothetical protein [Elusimicrobiaceae bacterium]
MKKIMMFALIGVLGFSPAMATQSNNKLMRPITRAAQKVAAHEGKVPEAEKPQDVFVNLVKEMQNARYPIDGSRMEMTEEELEEAWENPPFDLADYLRLLGDSALSVKYVKWEDADVHALLMQGDDTNDRELKVYQYLSKTFEKMYDVSPLDGSLDQYKDFYQVMGDVYPEAVLGTIGVWATNNLFDVVPFRIDNNYGYYWRVPQASLTAYNVMGLIDEKLTPEMVFSYMIKQHALPGETEEDIEDLKNEFFGTWRNQPDPSLPCVKDADELERKLIAKIKGID